MHQFFTQINLMRSLYICGCLGGHIAFKHTTILKGSGGGDGHASTVSTAFVSFNTTSSNKTHFVKAQGTVQLCTPSTSCSSFFFANLAEERLLRTTGMLSEKGGGVPCAGTQVLLELLALTVNRLLTMLKFLSTLRVEFLARCLPIVISHQCQQF